MASERKRLGISLAITGLVCGVAVLMLGRGPLLRVAARSGDVLGARVLLAVGTEPDAADGRGRTPLMRAAGWGRLEVAKLLLQHGANPGKAMHSAAVGGHVEMVELLLNSGAPVDAYRAWGMTPLYRAAEYGRTDVVEYLLSRGADANGSSTSPGAPLFVAAGTYHAERDEIITIVKALLAHGAEPDPFGPGRYGPLHVAASMGRTEVVRLLLDAGADANARSDNGMTPLPYAVRARSVELVTLLVERGAEVNTVDASGRTPLLSASEDGALAIAKILVEAGACVDVQDSSGRTPLSLASRSGYRGLVRLLLARGASVSMADAQAWTPLHHAVYAHHEKVAQMLVQAGADVSQGDKFGRTPRQVGLWGDHRHELWRGFGDLDAEAMERRVWYLNALDGGRAYSQGDLDSPGPLGYTLLHCAVLSGDIDSVGDLLERGASVDSRTEEGKTPMDFAISLGYEEIAELLRQHGATD